MATQQQIALTMLAQLRVLDPAISSEVGTPSRKILDTVAQALAESQVDLNALQTGLDLDGKFGSDLDRFLSLFGFGRQRAIRATGFVTFSRTGTSNFDIPISQGTQIVAPGVIVNATPQDIVFQTTEGVTLTALSTSIIAPIECVIAGTNGNVAANTITTFGTAPVLGITAVTNTVPTNGGLDLETDDELKLRFKNTVFRNLSGTADQFLALAVATAFTTKANVVGPISRYREYIQVPTVDDASADPNSAIPGNGAANQWTSALSTIPYSKHIYGVIPYFISNNQSGTDAIFYRQDTDYTLNSLPANKNRGDAYREYIEAIASSPLALSALYQPNITFLNVYSSTDTTVQAVRPQDVVLFEHSYMSTASRNDWSRNITNAVDVYINGQNPTVANSIIATPTASARLFTANTTDAYYYDNYRRVGEPQHRPVVGNIFTPLFWSPVTDLPNSITVGVVTYFNGVHYWLVNDISSIGLSVRARDGIEWATNTNGLASGDPVTLNPDGTVLSGGPYTGAKIGANTTASISIDSYTYDKNINDLQAALEGSKQITTDTLGHTATTRYFKLDVTVMYVTSVSTSDVNTNIQTAVSTFFNGQYFGTTIQLSDLLQVIHNVSGVDNVRWSKEILTAQSLTVDAAGKPRDRVVECDINGNSLVNVIADRTVTGDGSTVEVWQYYLTGSPTGGTYTLSYGGHTTAAIAYNAAAATINTALSSASIPATVTSGSGTSSSPFILTFSAIGARLPSLVTTDGSKLTGGITIFNNDFYLTDNQLPTLPTGTLATDSVAGLVIRPRAQNTWSTL